MEIIEGDWSFSCSDDCCKASKLDEESFYRNRCEMLDGFKAVDIVIYNDKHKQICFLECKDFSNHETENKWRLIPNNGAKRETNKYVKDGKDSLDIEFEKKVVSSIACIYGAKTMAKDNDISQALKDMAEKTFSSNVLKNKIYVALFVEGITKVKTRTPEMQMSCLMEAIKNKLKWLNCKVYVVNNKSVKETPLIDFFEVRKVAKDN